MSQTEIRTTQEEYLARRLLANGATGALPHLNALAHAYPYHGSDLRPVELVMSFLRDPPLSYPSLRLGASGGVNTEPLLRTLACLDVVHRVGRSVASDTPSCTAFSVMLKDGWPSLLVWLTYTLEYVEMVMPGARAGVPISTVANFLVAYSTRPPFAHHTIDDWTSTIRLAFRIWIGEFSQGLTFRNVTLTTIEFFSNCLEMDGSAKAAVVEIFQDSNRAWAFFKSFGTQITTLARDPTEAGAMRVVLMHDFYVLLVEHLSKSPDWRNTWRWIIQKGPLKACVATTLSLLSRPISIDRWRLAQLGSVMVAVEEDIEAILSKVVRLSRAGLAPLLRQCGRSTVSGVSDMVIFGFLRHLASYLPYQRVSRAVTKSLERYHANNPSALQDAGWNFFYSTLKLSVLSAAKRRGYFAFACDNLNDSKTLKTTALSMASLERCAAGVGQSGTVLKSVRRTIGTPSIDTNVSMQLPYYTIGARGGVWVTRKTHKIHQGRNRASQVQDDIVEFVNHDKFIASSILANGLDTAPSQPPITLPTWAAPSALTDSAFYPSPSSTAPHHNPSPLLTRLELQDIRYKLLDLNLPRPGDLEFSLHPSTTYKPERFSVPYKYDGVANAAPFHLIVSPANAHFLDCEFRLHALANRLYESIEVEADFNFELQRQSIDRDVKAALNRLFQWKKDLWWEKRLKPGNYQDAGDTLAIPRIETTRYLQLYNYGDPEYAPLALAGIVLVLVVHLIFNGSQTLCSIILGFLQDQLQILGPLLGSEGRQRQLKESYPTSIESVLNSVDLDPCVRRYIQCPKCYALYPTSSDYPDLCTHEEAPGSSPCNAKLTRVRDPDNKRGENLAKESLGEEKGGDGERDEKRQPITYYLHQGNQWLGRFLCRPDIEDLLDRRKAEFLERSNKPIDSDQPGLVADALDSEIVSNFTWPDGKRFYECPNDEFRLIFSLSGDGFNPFSNREAKQTVTSTGLYLFCLNLPLEERQKPQNVYLAGVIPGPGKPSTSQINHHTSLIVDDFVRFWETGVRYTRTTRRRDGVSARAATAPVLSDALGSRQLCGYGSPTSTFFYVLARA
ncbi:hypothetical protein D9611_008258 [Ephemerocybe angulata]|uniref:Uncharacterized protein n=1 Tax=Ephemerocybe angulata TaxID=980116 RepID=A0A8H5BIG4_9AGAR|nr:hypothetical protein D9611_008258 [Tulosesus angulatus]